MAAALVGGAFLTSFVNVLFDRLSSREVVNWIKGKKLDEKLCTRLKRTRTVVQVVLSDAEQKQITNPLVKEWLADLEDAVYKADDLLDEIYTKAVTQKDAGNILTRYFNSSQDRKMVSKIEEVVDALEEIEKHKDILGLKEIANVNMSRRTPSTSLVEKSEIYGRDEDKEAIIKLLLNDACDARVSVIPIVGMGGVGKTSLAQLVYNDDELKGKFDYKAWVCVGEEFDIVKVTKAVIAAVTSSSCDENDLNLLQIDLKGKLCGKKILVVLDDVWNNDFDDWKIFLKPFQHGNRGSKILVTSRTEKVAFVTPTIPPYKLSLLSIEDCWSIFLKCSFLSHESREYSALEQIGRKIVEKCKGLPLAVETLGCLLRTNYEVKYWDKILQNDIWKFLEDKSGIIPALRISYHYLPSHLKRCFVYCSLYPKDFQFDKDELILMWMAENFLQPNGMMTFEEIGCEYFSELVARSFLQSSRATEGSFVMHDLMHDLATICAGEFYFRVKELENPPKISTRARHLSLNARGNTPVSEVVGVFDTAKHIRTILGINSFVKPDQFIMENAPCIFVSQLKYVRVLSFKYSRLESLPHSIGELMHLRYLDLSKTPIVTLPESLRNLYNLQTLKLFHCYQIEMLPTGMQDLVNLRHLDIRGTRLKEMPKGMSKLKHLQFLSDFVVGKYEENKISELGALPNLHRSLCIDKLENVTNSGEALKARMTDKKHIMVLTLRWSLDNSFLDSQVERDILDKLQPHKELINLKIKGYRGTKFPHWLGHSSYCNMTLLNLDSCRNCYVLSSLGQLPSLKDLFISRFDGVEIIGDEFYGIGEFGCETPFPSLEHLEFDELCCWREWRSYKLDVFPRLKELTINNCPMLMGDLPNHLPALEKLIIDGCKQLACSLPRAPVILSLWIARCDVLRIQEIPLSLRSLSIEGSQPVESTFEAMTPTLPTCLRQLHITSCSSAISFPGDSIPASLEIVYITNCAKLEFPMQQEHKSLQSIVIVGSCDSLTSFHLESFPHLKNLAFRRCDNLKSLVTSETYLLSLESLFISECPNFISFSTLGTSAPKLEVLHVSACPKIDSFPNGFLPRNLRILSLKECDKLVRCLTLMDLHSHGLTYLEIKGPCEGVNAFPKEGWLPASLKSLLLWGFESLETLDCRGFLHLTSFQYLIIQDCPKLENIVGERFPAFLTLLSLRYSPLLGERCQKKDPGIWPKISHISSIKVEGEQIH